MAVLSFSPPPSGPPSKRLRIGSMQMMSSGASGKAALDRLGDAHAALGVEQQLQLRRGDEGVARGGEDLGRQRDLLQPLAQVVVLDLGLQVEDAQRPRRGEAEERQARGHVHEPADQEVALADLRRAAQHQQAARRQHARRDDVLGHRARVVEQRAEGEGGHLLRRGRAGRRAGSAAGRSSRHAAPRAARTRACSRSTGQGGRSMAAL